MIFSNDLPFLRGLQKLELMNHRNVKALEHLPTFDQEQKFKIPGILYEKFALGFAFPLLYCYFLECHNGFSHPPPLSIVFSPPVTELHFEVYTSKFVLTVVSPGAELRQLPQHHLE